MLFFGLVFLILGIGNLGQKLPEIAVHNARFIIQLAPLEVWYTVCILAGALLLAGAFLKSLEAVGFGAAMFVSTLFSGGYWTAWLGDLIDHTYGSRAWTSAVLFGAIAIVQPVIAGWNDPSRRVR